MCVCVHVRICLELNYFCYFLFLFFFFFFFFWGGVSQFCVLSYCCKWFAFQSFSICLKPYFIEKVRNWVLQSKAYPHYYSFTPVCSPTVLSILSVTGFFLLHSFRLLPFKFSICSAFYFSQHFSSHQASKCIFDSVFFLIVWFPFFDCFNTCPRTSVCVLSLVPGLVDSALLC